MAPKVLHITLSASHGGGPEHVLRLASALSSYSVEQYIACPHEKPYREKYEELLGADKILTLAGRRICIMSLWRLVRYVKANKIDIVHSHGKGAGLYGRLVSLLSCSKGVHTFHGLHYPSPRVLKILYIGLERALGFVTAAGISVSPGEYSDILAKGMLPKSKVFLIANGVNVSQSKPEGSFEDPEDFVVVHATRFDHKQKNSRFVLTIAERLLSLPGASGIRFVMIGDGPARHSIELEARQLGLEDKISFLGFQNDARSIFRQAHVYLSTSNWEGLPLAALEAQAEGVPAVVSGVVGNVDAIESGKTGFAYTHGDAEDAAQKILALKQDAALYEDFKNNAWLRIRRRFNLTNMARKTFAVYRSALSS